MYGRAWIESIHSYLRILFTLVSFIGSHASYSLIASITMINSLSMPHYLYSAPSRGGKNLKGTHTDRYLNNTPFVYGTLVQVSFNERFQMFAKQVRFKFSRWRWFVFLLLLLYLHEHLYPLSKQLNISTVKIIILNTKQM